MTDVTFTLSPEHLERLDAYLQFALAYTHNETDTNAEKLERMKFRVIQKAKELVLNYEYQFAEAAALATVVAPDEIDMD